MTRAPLSQLISNLMQLLEGIRTETVTQEVKTKVLGWIKEIPPGARPPELPKAVARAFGLTLDDVAALIESPYVEQKKDFGPLLPRTGWIAEYMDYTATTEPPDAFHFFVAASMIGSALKRNVYFPRGGQIIYPNLCIILVAPSGKCRKTSACNLGVSLFTAVGGFVLADKLTPEALIEAFKESSEATGLIYAPELAVFLGKQKYQEGMVPMLTALFDCPDIWKSGTIMRGEAELRNVGLTLLGASTLDWIQNAIPKDAFGGGFMSRILFVVQEDTPRSFPLPPPLSTERRGKLLEGLRKLTIRRGEFKMTPEAESFYTNWYNSRKDVGSENKHFAGYSERKPDHLLRLGMVLEMSDFPRDGELVYTQEKLQHALKILDWTETWLPSTFDQLNETSVGSDQIGIIKQLKSRGGAERHSALLRLNCRRMNATQFRQAMDTLKAAGLVDWDANTKSYLLTPEGWK